MVGVVIVLTQMWNKAQWGWGGGGGPRGGGGGGGGGEASEVLGHRLKVVYYYTCFIWLFKVFKLVI